MYNFEHLLSPEIKQKLEIKNLNLIITLSSIDCDDRWPSCKITIDDELIFDGQIVKIQKIIFNKNFSGDVDNFKLNIEMYGKTNQDTKLDKNGNIASNQMLEISELKLNSIDIIKNGLIYQGKFVMQLSKDKISYFKNNNISTENHDHHFYENGSWTLQIGLPVLTYIINNIKKTETFERIPYNDTMMAIIQKLEI